jgi:hypothetical protein
VVYSSGEADLTVSKRTADDDRPSAGICAFCQQSRDLRNSHLVPKALYRLTRARGGHSNPHPVIVTSRGRRQTSFQAIRPLLCADCEQRFDHQGEDWVMRHCYRGYGRLRLRELLRQSLRLQSDENFTIYSASSVPGVSIEKPVYFCISVFWRASVCDWESSGEKYRAISLGTKYQEQIRKYLLGIAELPQSASILVLASALKTPALVFNFPDTIRVESRHCHSLHIPGLTFQLSLGGQLEPGTIESCIMRSSFHPIFECKHGDARIQRGIFRNMGKIAPPWAEYPIVDGVV